MAIVAVVVLWQAGTVGAQGLPDSLAGKYIGTASSPNGDMAVSCELKIADGKLAGTIDSPQGPIAITGGTLTGDKIVLNIDMGGMAGTISGTMTNGRVTGQYTLGDTSGTCTLTKVIPDTAKPAAGADAKPAAAAADPISGVWDGVAGSDQMSAPFLLTLKLEGDKVTGEITSDQGGGPLTPGTWKDGALTVTFVMQQMGGNVTMIGALKEGKLIGSMDFAGQMQLIWAAVKRQ
jgi:hypothetical protein